MNVDSPTREFTADQIAKLKDSTIGKTCKEIIKSAEKQFVEENILRACKKIISDFTNNDVLAYEKAADDFIAIAKKQKKDNPSKASYIKRT